MSSGAERFPVSGRKIPRQYSRNLGFFSPEEQEQLQDATVAIAGVGGDGGELAVELARMGIGRLRLADPEVFDTENINRQEASSHKTVDRNKAEVIAEVIDDIANSPEDGVLTEVEVYTSGINRDNIHEFITGVDVAADETEYTQHEIGVMLARAARDEGVPVVMALNVGFGGYTTSFHPQGMTFEKYLGLDEDAPLEEIAKKDVPLQRWVPHIPSYADTSMFKRIATGEVSAPTVAPGVKVAAADAGVQIAAHILGKEDWVQYAPHGRSIDIIDGTNIVRNPRTHFYRSFAKAAFNTWRGKNTRTEY